jgi:hypothetical protein
MLRINLHPAKVGRLLGLLVVLLTLAHLAALWSTLRYGRQHGEFIINLFDLDSEHNIPTLFASACLLGCAALLALIAHADQCQSYGHAHYWRLLSLAFLGLAADEVLVLHEQINTPLRNWLGVGGALHFAWVIPYGLGLLVLLSLGIGFIRRLPNRSRLLFGSAGALYVGGALGMELLGAHIVSTQGRGLTYEWVTTLEEVLEMSGVALFIYALLSHIERQFPGTHMMIGASPDRHHKQDRMTKGKTSKEQP